MSDPAPRHSQLRWLADELAGLVANGVIDGATAERLRAHYALDRLGPRRNWAVFALSVLGAAMIGAGVVLILAHNWDELSRSARAVLCLGMLLGAQAGGAWVLARRAASPAWRESAAVGITAATGAAIALVSQTYHVEGDLADFMRSWLWLVLPVIYLFDSRVVCAFVFAAAPVVAFERDQAPLAYLALVAASSPYLAHLLRSHADRVLTHFVVLVAAVSVPIGCGAFLEHAYLSPWPVFYGGYAGALAALGLRFERAGAPSFAAPLSTAALVGAVTLGVALTFEDAWRAPYARASTDTATGVGFLVAGALLGVVALVHVARAWTARQPAAALGCALPAVTGIGQILLHARAPVAAGLVLHNLYLLALGIAALAGGIAAGSLRRTNGGLAVLAVLFLVRFFDVDLSFVTRGLGFIAVGVSFVAVNVWLARRKREVTA